VIIWPASNNADPMPIAAACSGALLTPSAIESTSGLNGASGWNSQVTADVDAVQDSLLGPGRAGLLMQKIGLTASPILRVHKSASHPYTKHIGSRTLDDIVEWIASGNGSVSTLATLELFLD